MDIIAYILCGIGILSFFGGLLIICISAIIEIFKLISSTES
jgi:hypothetical protein